MGRKFLTDTESNAAKSGRAVTVTGKTNTAKSRAVGKYMYIKIYTSEYFHCFRISNFTIIDKKNVLNFFEKVKIINTSGIWTHN